MNFPGHVMILASAGSGKTYALTNRFIGLFARGAPPERIAALTFTRKAAGEFFDEILRKLAGAARDESAARRLAADIGLPALTCADFLRLLRAMTEAMHRLNLGTLDSFFARIVRAFPLELGLGGDFELLQDHAARLERRRVLRRLFAHTATEEARRDFIEAFKRATFGTEEKRLGQRLDAFLDEHAEVFHAAPAPEWWGRADRIWPEGSRWLAAADESRRRAAATALRAALPWPAFGDKQRARWEDFFSGLSTWTPGAPLPKPVAYLVENAFKAWPGLTEIVVERKKVALDAAASVALREVVTGIVGAELTRRLEMTQGMFSVLRSYEEIYDSAVRRSGRLTFADVQRLLRPEAPDGIRRLTREAAAEARLFIDWRLDAQIDHWLLDEFQDTSFGQWEILRNLIDEAVQDPAGARTFFYVGDTKQAIYAWREGDSRLFREIFDHYNAASPEAIREERLDRSWRSGPAVIAMVNRVFQDHEAMGRLFPAEAVERWRREWRDHESARPELGGFATLRQASGAPGRFAATLAILRETDALARGLSVAVLVQKNSTAAELADYLRREGGLAAVAESDLLVGTDNPLSAALLALLRAAAHPGDTAAWTHLAMTPLARLLADVQEGGRDAVVRGVLEQVHAQGFERTVESWLRRIEPALAPDDLFSRERGRQLAEAARLFDETGGREVGEFLQFAERYAVRDAEVTAVVRVMTVHKAKGLGFDLVILPDLEGTKLAARRRGLAVQRAADRTVGWVLDLPPGIFHASDEVLSAHVAAKEAEACYEEFAVLYVAMTRAKRAMYVITEPVGASQSHNFSRLLRDTLGEEWSQGDPRWYEQVPPVAAEPGPGASLPAIEAVRAMRREARTPSGNAGRGIPAARVFSLDHRAGADFGEAMHALFAQVSWADPGAVAALARRWPRNAVSEEALACLHAPALAEVWRMPGDGAELWREQAFEVVLDGVWVTGVFDRVIVERVPSGRVVRATVYDFKTDRGLEADVVGAAARHREQLSLYRRVVGILTGLPAGAAQAEIVFTETALRVPLAE